MLEYVCMFSGISPKCCGDKNLKDPCVCICTHPFIQVAICICGRATTCICLCEICKNMFVQMYIYQVRKTC